MRTDVNLINIYRALAAYLVSIGHLEQVFVRPYTNLFTTAAGLLAQASVMIFFVISGYSITDSITNLINKPNAVKEYVLKRTCGIIPPLIATTILIYFMFLTAPYLFACGSRTFIKTE